MRIKESFFNFFLANKKFTTYRLEISILAEFWYVFFTTEDWLYEC